MHRPQIAEFNGVKWELFGTEQDAVKATDEMIAANRAKHNWITDEKDVLSKVNPALCSKFYYVHEDGIFL